MAKKVTLSIFKTTKQNTRDNIMLSKKIFLSTIFIMAIGLIGIQADAQDLGQDRQDGKSVKGEVKDAESDEGLSNIEVTIDELGESAMTDEEGNFTIEDVEPGSYTVNVQAEGYEEHSETVEVSEEGEAEVEITLRQTEGWQQQQDDQPTDRPTDAPQDDPADQPTDQPEDETQPPVPPM